MRFAVLRSIGHNVAGSLASGYGGGLIHSSGLGIWDLQAEISRSPGGFIEVDFLLGTLLAGKRSSTLDRLIPAYAAALPGLCERHRASLSEFRRLTARFDLHGPTPLHPWAESYAVTVEDQRGSHAVDHYIGRPGRRLRVRDHLGRIRRENGSVTRADLHNS